MPVSTIYGTDEPEQHPQLLVRKIGMGTANYGEGWAMTGEQCEEAMEEGRKIVRKLKTKGCNTIGFGEMGIGNTSSAALIMSSILELPVAHCAGRGTGASGALLATKIATLEKVASLHRIQDLREKPQELLARVGGFELAMMAGAFLEGAKQKMVVLVDGFICTAALLVAHAINGDVIHNCIFAHCSNEQGHRLMLEYLGATPLLNLGLRLGEGTGAALTLPLVQSAVLFLNEMASFESAAVSNAS